MALTTTTKQTKFHVVLYIYDEDRVVKVCVRKKTLKEWLDDLYIKPNNLRELLILLSRYPDHEAAEYELSEDREQRASSDFSQ